MDAAIASGICNGVFNAQSMGIGGGFLMLIYERDAKRMTVIDARETAPQNAFETMYSKNPELAMHGASLLSNVFIKKF